jgi:hypothetical protein
MKWTTEFSKGTGEPGWDARYHFHKDVAGFCVKELLFEMSPRSFYVMVRDEFLLNSVCQCPTLIEAKEHVLQLGNVGDKLILFPKEHER